MSAIPDAVAELDRLLLDDPYGEEIEEVMLVAGDLLQAMGRPRGELIAHELALAAARGPAERASKAALLDDWITRHQAAILGSLAPLRERRGALRYELRGGRLRALSIDARRVVRPGSGLRVGELMQVVVAAPAVRGVTELRVRVRDEAEAAEALTVVLRAGRRLPLELLIISPTTRPFGHQTRGHAVDLRKIFPHLWMVTRYARIAPLIDPELPDPTSAFELGEFAAAPMSQELRIRIGRGLSSGRELTTKAACELLAGLGSSARVFVPSLALLLRPQVSHAAAWILPQLPKFGAWVQALVPRVRSITGSEAHYSGEIRSLAGKCLRDLS
jgi:hypothetical protein